LVYYQYKCHSGPEPSLGGVVPHNMTNANSSMKEVRHRNGGIQTRIVPGKALKEALESEGRAANITHCNAMP
jgi:hypothetical protein